MSIKMLMFTFMLAFLVTVARSATTEMAAEESTDNTIPSYHNAPPTDTDDGAEPRAEQESARDANPLASEQGNSPIEASGSDDGGDALNTSSSPGDDEPAADSFAHLGGVSMFAVLSSAVVMMAFA